VTLSRTGGLTIAAAASLLYTALVFGRTVFPSPRCSRRRRRPTALEIITMFANAGPSSSSPSSPAASPRAVQIQSRTLRDLRAVKDLVFESVGTGLIALDRSHTITTFNRAATTIPDVPAAGGDGPAVARAVRDLVSLPTIEAGPGCRARRPEPSRGILARPGGRSVPVRLTFWALKAGGRGRAARVICACEDLTRCG